MTIWFDCPECGAHKTVSGLSDYQCTKCESHIGMPFIGYKEFFKQHGIHCPRCGGTRLEPANSQPEKDIFCHACGDWFFVDRHDKVEVIASQMAKIKIG